ncbi:MAG: SMI1/KNR4 family protein [Cognatishimia sp.]|uniref:SMI1/KNR4 family protein n=1 Tax=Cognatishimia sp. TaxID=2211648 RepID=UPI003B8C15C3
MNISALKNRFSKLYSAPRGPTVASNLDSDLPVDYLVFLQKIGGGTIGDTLFEIYDRPLTASEIYGDVSSLSLSGIWFLGDDYNGYCVGLDPSRDWAVVEVDKVSKEKEVIADSLVAFLMHDFRLGDT